MSSSLSSRGDLGPLFGVLFDFFNIQGAGFFSDGGVEVEEDATSFTGVTGVEGGSSTSPSSTSAAGFPESLLFNDLVVDKVLFDFFLVSTGDDSLSPSPDILNEVLIFDEVATATFAVVEVGVFEEDVLFTAVVLVLPPTLILLELVFVKGVDFIEEEVVEVEAMEARLEDTLETAGVTPTDEARLETVGAFSSNNFTYL